MTHAPDLDWLHFLSLLSPRPTTCLRRMKISSLDALCEFSEAALLREQNIGKASTPRAPHGRAL
jgi:hypothetical protein